MGLYHSSEEKYSLGDYKGASQVFIEDNDGEVPDADSDALLSNLYMGAADFTGADFDASIADFDRALDGFEEQSQFNAIQRLTSGYIGKGHDEAMLDTYKAISYLAKNDPDGARVEFNRAEDVSRKIAEKNKETIDEKAAAAAVVAAEKGDNANGGKKPDTAQSMETLSQANDIDENKVMLDNFRHSVDALCGAGDYENPAIFFLDGVRDLFWGEDADDRESAATSFKKAYGLTSSQVALDAAILSENIAAGKKSSKDISDTVCVFFENGLGATLESNLNTFIVPVPCNGNVTLVPVGLDLPKLVERVAPYPNLIVRDSENILGTTFPLSSMDRLVATEFRAEIPGIIVRQSMKAVIQATISYILIDASRRALGSLGEAMAVVAIAALASKNICPADLRHWNFLPKEFQACFVPRPTSGNLHIYAPGMPEPLIKVELPQSGPALVYVKMPYANTPPLVVVAGPNKK